MAMTMHKGLGAVLLLIAAFMSGQASAAGACDGKAFILPSILKLDAGKIEPRHLVQTLQNLSENQRQCETEFLVQTALGAPLAEYAASNRSADGAWMCGLASPRDVLLNHAAKTKALETLAELGTPWRIGDDRETETSANAIYTLLHCVDEDQEALRSDPQARRLRRAIEAAHAHVANGFVDATLQDNTGPCELVERRRKVGRAFERYRKSEFSVRAALLSASADLSGLWLGDCGEVNWLESAAASLDLVFENNKFAQSIEGWRWVNDAAYAQAIIHILRGDQARFAEAAKMLSAAGDVEGDEVLYRSAGIDRIHPVARELIGGINAARAKSGREPYEDQVYLYRFVPGVELIDVPPVRNYFSVSAIVEGLGAVRSVEPFTCKGDCRRTMGELNRLLHKSTVRTDLTVVLGSFFNRTSALRARSHVCSVVFGAKGECPVRTEELGRYYRVAHGPMSEIEANAFVKLLQKNDVTDYFLSRPRVLDVL